MTDIKFACPHCQQHLEAPPDIAGQNVNCPSCKQRVTIPTQADAPRASLSCPACGQALEATEDILGQTLECPSCHENFAIADSSEQCERQATASVQSLPPDGHQTTGAATAAQDGPTSPTVPSMGRASVRQMPAPRRRKSRAQMAVIVGFLVAVPILWVLTMPRTTGSDHPPESVMDSDTLLAVCVYDDGYTSGTFNEGMREHSKQLEKAYRPMVGSANNARLLVGAMQAGAEEALSSRYAHETEAVRRLAAQGFDDGRRGRRRAYPPLDAIVTNINQCVDMLNSHGRAIETTGSAIGIAALAARLPALVQSQLAPSLCEQGAPQDGEFLSDDQMASRLHDRRSAIIRTAISALEQTLTNQVLSWSVTFEDPEPSTSGYRKPVDTSRLNGLALTFPIPLTYDTWVGPASQDFVARVFHELHLKGNATQLPSLFYQRDSSDPFGGDERTDYSIDDNGVLSVVVPCQDAEVARAVKEQNPHIILRRTVRPVVALKCAWRDLSSPSYRLPYDTAQGLEVSGGLRYSTSVEVAGGVPETPILQAQPLSNPFEKQPTEARLRRILGLPATNDQQSGLNSESCELSPPPAPSRDSFFN